MFFRICRLLLRRDEDFVLLQQIQSAVLGIPLTINTASTVMAPGGSAVRISWPRV